MKIGNFEITWGKKARKEIPKQIFFTGGWTGLPDDLESYIENGYNTNAAVYAIITLKARKFASVPRYVYEIKDSQAYKRYKALLSDIKNVNLYRLEKSRDEAIREIKNGHPLQALLDRPNKYESAQTYLEKAAVFKFAAGFSSSYINTGLGKEPLELEILPSQHINIVPDGTLHGIKSFNLIMNSKVEFMREQVLYWSYPNYSYNSSGEHLYGLSPVKAALKDIDANSQGKVGQAAMFTNQGAKAAIYDKSGETTSAQAETTRDRIDEIINNNARAGSVTFLNGDMGLLQFGMSSTDLQLIQAIGLTKRELCNVWQVPPILMAIEDPTYSNLQEARKDFVTNSVWPECTSFDDQIKMQLLPMYGNDKTITVASDISALPEMQDDMKQMADIFATLPVIIPNDILEAFKFDRQTDPNMEKVYIKNGYSTLEDMNVQPSADLGQVQQDLANQGLKDYGK